MHNPQEAVISYARQAFSVVLEQHDHFVLPAAIQAIPLESGDIALHHETEGFAACAQFAGDAQSGSLTLKRIKTTDWNRRFNTVDQFKGSQHDGTPILLSPH